MLQCQLASNLGDSLTPGYDGLVTLDATNQCLLWDAFTQVNELYVEGQCYVSAASARLTQAALTNADSSSNASAPSVSGSLMRVLSPALALVDVSQSSEASPFQTSAIRSSVRLFVLLSFYFLLLEKSLSGGSSPLWIYLWISTRLLSARHMRST